mgnify:CR=1 FL=1
MTANAGTPNNIPRIPNKPPPRRIDTITPECGQPGGISKNLWPKYITVKLLQQQDEDQEIDSLHRICKCDQNRTRNCSDIWPEERNYIRHTHNHADKHCIRHIQKRCTNKAQNSDNDRINDLTDDKSPEYLICLYCNMNQQVGTFCRKIAYVAFLL